MNKKITIIIAFMSLAAILMLSAKVELAKAVTRNFTLYGSNSLGWGFTPGSMTKPGPSISVDQGDLVNLTLISQDGLPHQFLVDYSGNGVFDSGEPLSDQFSSATVFQFTANTNGTFTYLCTIHPTMTGGFTVVPEFPAAAILPIFIILTLLAVIALRKTSAHNSANA